MNPYAYLRKRAQAFFHDPQIRADAIHFGLTAAAVKYLGPSGVDVVDLISLAARSPARLNDEDAPVACIIPTVDPELAAGYIVYSLKPEKRADGVWATVDSAPQSAPHWFFDRHVATLYAQHVLGAQMVESHDGTSPRDQTAWRGWIAATVSNGPRELFQALGNSYIQAPAPSPGEGLILWRPILTTRGVDIGVLSEESPCSVTDPPFVFPDLAKARQTIALERRDKAEIKAVSHLPEALVAQLQPAPVLGEARPAHGGFVYARNNVPPLWIRPSSPEPFGPRRRGPDGEPRRNWHPDWYVSPHPQGAFAWHPIGGRDLVCLMAPSHQGEWRVQRWRDVSIALRDLGHAGVWAQRAPEFDPSPPSLGAHRVLRSPSGPSL